MASSRNKGKDFPTKSKAKPKAKRIVVKDRLGNITRKDTVTTQKGQGVPKDMSRGRISKGRAAVQPRHITAGGKMFRSGVIKAVGGAVTRASVAGNIVLGAAAATKAANKAMSINSSTPAKGKEMRQSAIASRMNKLSSNVGTTKVKRKKSMSGFEKAFSMAREVAGPGHIFTYKGKKYTTNYKKGKK